MATSDYFNAVVDELKDRITANGTVLGLGATPRIYEKDEHPAILAENHQIPCALVIPLLYSGDEMASLIDGDVTYHKFGITTVGIYQFEDTELETALRTTRSYGFAFLELFTRKTSVNTQQVERAAVVNKKLEQMYFVTATHVIYCWLASQEYTAFFPLA